MSDIIDKKLDEESMIENDVIFNDLEQKEFTENISPYNLSSTVTEVPSIVENSKAKSVEEILQTQKDMFIGEGNTTEDNVERIIEPADSKKLRERINDYCDLLTETAVFNTNVNKEEIKGLFIEFMEDLYLREPKEAVDFLNQQPSKKIIENIYMNFGIRKRYINDYPDILKSKTAFLLNSLFNNKGSVEAFIQFGEVLKEFYKNINFYNITVEEKVQTSIYKTYYCKSLYYSENKGILGSYYESDIYKYKQEEVGRTFEEAITYNKEDTSVSTFVDELINYKIFITEYKTRNKIVYLIKFFEPLYLDAYLQLSYAGINGEIFLVPKDSTEFEITVIVDDIKTIEKYKNAVIDSLYSTDIVDVNGMDENLPSESYGFTDGEDLSKYIDKNIFARVQVGELINEVIQYKIIFQKALIKDCKIKINIFDTAILVPRGSEEYTFDITITDTDLNDQVNATRDAGNLIYSLEPIYLSDPTNVIEEIQTNDIDALKYYMNRLDYFDSDNRNKTKKNIFPIKTNIVYMQFQASESIDSMNELPELIRMYAMTKLYDMNYSFTIQTKSGNISANVNLEEYIQLLTYTRLKEVQYKQSGLDKDNLLPLEFNKFAKPNPDAITPAELVANENLINKYSSSTLQLSDLPMIIHLLEYYKDMVPTYKQLKYFKYNLEILRNKNLREILLFNLEDFKIHLRGTLPEDWKIFWQQLEDYFPNDIVIEQDVDINLQLKETVRYYYSNLEVQKNNMGVSEFYSSLKSLNKEELELNNDPIQKLDQKFTRKFPRLISAINNIDKLDDYIGVYLYNFKQMQSYTKLEDHYIQAFVTDVFSGLLLGSSFKEKIFNPVLKLFQHYFFNAEATMENNDITKIQIRNKLNSTPVFSEAFIELMLNEEYSEQSYDSFWQILIDNKIIDKYELNDNFTITIKDEETNEETIYND